jgi:small-conductance mechanosensitive channel/CRP-like cAMP-binding protein
VLAHSLTLLAQTAPETTAATAPAFQWLVYSNENLVHATLLFAGVAIVSLIFLFFIRKLLRRFHLAIAAIVAAFAVAIYAGGCGLVGGVLFVQDDGVSYWILRVVAAALLFSFLRVVDRLAILPLLTRRGRIPVPRVVHQIVNIVLVSFVILIFGSVAFGWDIDKFLAGSAVVSIVLGLALQETLGNFLSGIVVQAAPPFAIGHRIKCEDHEGDVVDMTWRAVTLRTDEDDYIIIPNATIAKSDIINYSVPTRATARYVQVGIDYDVPPADAVAVLKRAAMESEGVIGHPEPIIYMEKFGDSAIEYSIKFWLDNPGEHEIVQHHVRMNTWYRLKEAGYNIPFPIRTVEHTSAARKERRQLESARDRRLAAIDLVPLFQPLSPDQKRQLAESANDLLLTAGQILFQQNDPGDSFFIIARGQVDVLIAPEGAPAGAPLRKVATLSTGDFFGEMSALTGQPRTATIRAASPVCLVRVEKQDLQILFDADPSLLEKISALVARRNAEREAIRQGPGTVAAPEAITRQQKSLLGRMMSFFRLNAASTPRS